MTDLLVEIPPWVYLGTVMGIAVSLLFYAAIGHRERSPFWYPPFGLAGFFAGNWVGNSLGLTLLQLGDVQAAAALAGALLALVLLHLVIA
ncbi:MAG: hypothetical protein F4Y67_09675 [Chloroflexi bacterium]|nr:hypothetical protein [Chloroflexota bacterium]